MLIKNNWQQRIDQHEKKKTLLLNFLAEECYSDVPTLMKVINVKQRSTLDKMLRTLINLGLIRKFIFELKPNEKISTWGITRNGLTNIRNDYALDGLNHFVPSRIIESTVTKKLLTQKIKMRMEALCCTGYIAGNQKNKRYFPTEYLPTAYIKLTNDMPIVIEADVRIKSSLRYKQIILQHLLARNQKHWHYVLFVTVDIYKKAAITRAINNIDHVTHRGIKRSVDKSDKNIFKIHTLEEIQNLKLTEVFGRVTS